MNLRKKVKHMSTTEFNVKYKNQDFLRDRIEEFKTLSKDDQVMILIDLSDQIIIADHEYKKINAYTAPEEIERREQALAYYKELMKEIGR